MVNSNLPEPELLKAVLEPLLDDFQYWFERSRSLLENETITFLGTREQAKLLQRVSKAQQEVATARLLFQATGSQVGLEMATLMPWHQLLTECWQLAIRFRQQRSAQVPETL